MEDRIVSYWYEEVWDYCYLHVINSINNNSHLLGLLSARDSS